MEGFDGKKLDRMKSELTEENFNQIVESYNQMKERQNISQQIKEALQNGDYEKAVQLREQLGSLGGFGGRRGGFVW